MKEEGRTTRGKGRNWQLEVGARLPQPIAEIAEAAREPRPTLSARNRCLLQHSSVIAEFESSHLPTKRQILMSSGKDWSHYPSRDGKYLIPLVQRRINCTPSTAHGTSISTIVSKTVRFGKVGIPQRGRDTSQRWSVARSYCPAILSEEPRW